MKPIRLYAGAALLAGLAACGGNSTPTDAAKDSTTGNSSATTVSVHTEEADYQADTLPSKGFVAYDANRKEKLPIVIVAPEWWGVTDYAKMRARMLAELGYFAMVMDPYGHGDTAANPKDAMNDAKPYYADPVLCGARLQAALAKAATYPQADTSKAGAIGYCFGGFVVLNAAKLGEPLKGVVSFHGDLRGVPPSKEKTKAGFLICQGGADPFVPPAQQAAFKKSFDSAGIRYTFNSYPGALHAFTNPAATENGKKFNMPIAYNAAADSASWADMKTFLNSTLR